MVVTAALALDNDHPLGVGQLPYHLGVPRTAHLDIYGGRKAYRR